MTQKMMLKRLIIALLIGAAILVIPVMAGCSGLVDSDPQGAMIYFNGVYTGYETPHEFDPLLMPPAPINEIKLIRLEYYDLIFPTDHLDILGGPLCDNHCYMPQGLCSFEFKPTLVQKPYIATPEFPSTFLPVAMIIGFLGAVLLIQRTREK